jgi:ubiquinol-cytochrome c reductase iron-sulfur subunit
MAIGKTRRDFVLMSASALATIGAGVAMWPLIASMKPSNDVIANTAVSVHLAHIRRGQTVRVLWKGIPVYVRRRTQDEIAAAQHPTSEPRVGVTHHLVADAERVKKGKEEWIVVIGVCSRDTCQVAYQDWNPYWLCHCCGTLYDISGRVYNTYPPKPAHDLLIPPYIFTSDDELVVG